MDIWNWDELPDSPIMKNQPVTASIGVFDGIHLGHQKILESVVNSGNYPLVITFRQNPARIFNPQKYAGDIFPLETKLQIFKTFGIKSVVLIDFSINFSKLAGRVFLERLDGFINLRQLIVGHDFQLGRDADTPARHLEEILAHKNIVVDIMEPFTLGSHRVSSSLIRQLILEGRIDEAKGFLGQEYFIALPELDKQHGKSWSLPKAVFSQVLPSAGEFPVQIENGIQRELSLLKVTSTHLEWECSIFLPKKITFG